MKFLAMFTTTIFEIVNSLRENIQFAKIAALGTTLLTDIDVSKDQLQK